MAVFKKKSPNRPCQLFRYFIFSQNPMGNVRCVNMALKDEAKRQHTWTERSQALKISSCHDANFVVTVDDKVGIMTSLGIQIMELPKSVPVRCSTTASHVRAPRAFDEYEFHQPRLVIRTFHRQGRCSRGGHLCNEHSEEKYSCSYK